MDALLAGIYSRWNDAGLDDSIAELYPAGEGSGRAQNVGGAPVATDIPRAEYYVSISPPSVKTRGSRVRQAIAVVQLWGRSTAITAGYVSSVHDAFVNSDDAGISPLAIAGGTVLQVDDAGSFVGKVDDNVFLGQQTLLIDYRIANSVPA